MKKPSYNKGDSIKDTPVLEGARKNVWRQLYELDRRVARLQRLGGLKGSNPCLTQDEAEILPMLLERR